jgi:hypothetical protein
MRFSRRNNWVLSVALKLGCFPGPFFSKLTRSAPTPLSTKSQQPYHILVLSHMLPHDLVYISVVQASHRAIRKVLDAHLDIDLSERFKDLVISLMELAGFDRYTW